MNRHAAPALLATLLASAAFIAPAGAPEPAAATAPRAGEKVFFAMSIADESGATVAEPKLLGVCGVPLEMTLAEPGRLSTPRMSLLLEPQFQEDGSYEIAFELSIPGRIDRGKGTMRLFPGEEKSTLVSYPGGHFEVQLAAFTVPSRALDLYLHHGATRPIAGQSRA
ncbi:MAG TPA: hypothetical protein VN033_02790 [Vulgatibacter sp.]|nr:hypothetical protein [Vulgatibacter sp.]